MPTLSHLHLFIFPNEDSKHWYPCTAITPLPEALITTQCHPNRLRNLRRSPYFCNTTRTANELTTRNDFVCFEEERGTRNHDGKCGHLLPLWGRAMAQIFNKDVHVFRSSCNFRPIDLVPIQIPVVAAPYASPGVSFIP